jgi:TP901 family phage tail tape measure protein
MADDQDMKYQVEIEGMDKAMQDIENLQEQLKKAQELKDKLYQAGDTRAFGALANGEEELYRRRMQAEAEFAKQKDATAANIQVNEKKYLEYLSQKIDAVAKLMDYQKQLQKQEQEAQRLYQTYTKDRMPESLGKFNEARTGFKDLKDEAEQFNKELGIDKESTSYLGSLGQKLLSYANSLFGGTMLADSFKVPEGTAGTFAQIEQAIAGIQQVVPGLIDNQKTVNEEMENFAAITAKFGEQAEEISSVGQLWGRIYDNLSIVNALTQQSVVLSVAANMSLTESAKYLETAMTQYGLIAADSSAAMVNSGRIIDVWTKLAHTAGTTVQTLAAAMERTGSVAKQAGLDFEFLAAMVATVIRATQLSGESIGNSMRSVLESIRSDKATAAIEAIGIATKQVGQDGQAELRKLQDVLLDIAIQAQEAQINLEDLFKKVADGQGDGAKPAAMLGEYQEFIRIWGEAVSSQGFAAGRVGAQLDAISRKLKQTTNELTSLITQTGNSGLTQHVQTQLNRLDMLISGMKKAPEEGYKAAGMVTMLATVLTTGVKAYKEFGAAMKEAAAVTGIFEKALALLGKETLVGAVLSVITYAVGLYTDTIGKADEAGRKAAQSKQEDVAAQQQQIQQLQSQSEYVDTLFAAREKLIAQSQQEGISAEKKILLNNEIQVTEQELTTVLGQEAMERIRQNNYSAASIDKEKTKFQNAIAEKQQALAVIRQEMAVDLDNKIDWLNNCITAYYQEVDAFKDSIGKKIALLGAWNTIRLTAQEWMTKFYEEKRDNAIEMRGKYKDDPERFDYWSKVKASAENDIQYHQNQGKGIVGEGLQYWLNAKEEVERNRLNVGQGIHYHPSGGNISNCAPIIPQKTQGNSSISPADSPQKPALDVYKLAQDKMFREAKQAAEEYTAALNTLNTNEVIYGKTVNSLIERQKTMKDRVADLTEQQAKYDNETKYLWNMLDEQIAKNSELQAALGVTAEQWKNMSSEDKLTFQMEKRELLEALNDLKAITSVMYHYEDKAEDVKKSLAGINDELRKMQLNSVYDPEKVHQRNLSQMDADEHIAENDLDMDYKGTNYNYEKHQMAYDNAYIKKQELNRRLSDLDKDKVKIMGNYKDAVTQADEDLQKALAKSGEESEEYAKALKTLTYAKTILDNAEKGETADLIDNAQKQQAVQVAISDCDKVMDQHKDKIQELRKDMADMFTDWAVRGTSWKDIMKRLLQDFAADAIRRIFQVQNAAQQTSFAGGLLGLLLGGGGKGKSGGIGKSNASSGGYKISKAAMDALLPTSFPHADGGIFDQPHVGLIAEAGKEGIVPIENRAKGIPVWAEVGKQLGVLGNNQGVVPYLKNPGIAKQAAIQVQVQQQDHISAIERSNQLLTQQNQMIAQLAKTGGNMTVLPIITQVSAEQVLQVLNDNPQALSNILGRQRNSGWR